MSKSKNYTQFTTGTYSGQRLLKEHHLEEEGLWQIKGEDPNCDMGGSHHQPDLGIVQGKLRDVIEYAVELSSFWSWGSGGDIKKIDNIKKIDSAVTMRRNSLLEKKAQLIEELDKIDHELVKLSGDSNA